MRKISPAALIVCLLELTGMGCDILKLLLVVLVIQAIARTCYGRMQMDARARPPICNGVTETPPTPVPEPADEPFGKCAIPDFPDAETDGKLPEAVARFARMLKNRYREARVELGRGMSKRPHRMRLEDIFVNLVLLPNDKVQPLTNHNYGSISEMQRSQHAFSSAAEQLKNVELADIFESQNCNSSGGQVDPDEPMAMRVLATASAGCGKTTVFTQVLPMKWALGLWPQIGLVAALPLRERSVRSARNLSELLKLEHFGFMESDRRAICQFISENPNQICIVLDGLDETTLDDCSDYVRNIIVGKELMATNMLLTSRPSSEVIKLSQAFPFSRRLELIGFTDANVREYVHKVLSDDKAEQLIHQIETNSHLEAIMKTPFFAAAMCEVFGLHNRIPQSLSGMMMELLLHIIQQRSGVRYPTWRSLPRHTREDILELGRFALTTLAQRKIIFDNTDFDMYSLSKNAKMLGFLVECDSGPFVQSTAFDEQWQFSHLTVHEYIAARYILSTSPSPSDMRWLVRELGVTNGHLSTFWCFVAGELSWESKEALLQSMLSYDDQCQTSQHSLARFCNPSKEQLSQVAEDLSALLDSVAITVVAEALLHDVLPKSVSVLEHIESTFPDGFAPTMFDFICAMLRIWVHHVPRASMRMLINEIQPIQPYVASQLSDIYAENIDIPEPVEQDYPSFIPYNQRLLAFRIFADITTEGDVHHVAPRDSESLRNHLRRCDGDMRLSARLTPSDCIAVSTVLQVFGFMIRRLDMQSWAVGNSGYESLSVGVERCSHLIELNISKNNLSDTHAMSVLRVIQLNTNTLRKLHLHGNSFTSTAMARFQVQICNCFNLQRLRLGSDQCVDENRNIATITGILQSGVQLTELALVNFQIGPEGLRALGPQLGHLQLQELCLDNVTSELTVDSVEAIHSILASQQRSLVTLSLSQNRLTDQFLRGIASGLQICTGIATLALETSALTSYNLSAVASLMPSLGNVQQLRLQGNDFSQDVSAADQLVAAVERRRQRLSLYMPDRHSVHHRIRAVLDAVGSEHLDALYVG
eukprot:scpid30467/ scgid10554/ Protein NLRC3